MTDIEPPTKRICLVAPKGSVSNNPFRMLPTDTLANIKAMNSDIHPPTQSALLMKDLDIHYVEKRGVEVLEVNVRQSAVGVHLNRSDWDVCDEIAIVTPTYR